MGSFLVVLADPPVGRFPNIVQRREQTLAQQLFTEGSVEALDVGFLIWLARLIVLNSHARCCLRPAGENPLCVKIDLTADAFNYTLIQRALDRDRLLDGKLLLVTNMPDHEPEEIVARYRSLADIVRGFRVPKSDIEIAPVYQRLPERIRAHALDLPKRVRVPLYVPRMPDTVWSVDFVSNALA